MASIQTDIVLQDNFSNVAYEIIDATYMMTSAVYEAEQALSANVDTSSIENAHDEINQVTMAMNELNAASQQNTPVLDAGSGQVINMAVNPVLPDPLVENPEPVTLDIQPNAPPTGAIGQRIENIRNQLESVVSAQHQIDQAAATVDVLPQEVTKRMSRVNSLIEQIQANLAFTVENPFGLGGQEIEMQLSAIQKLINQATQQQNMLSNAVRGTGQLIRDNTSEQTKFNREIDSGSQGADRLTDMVKNAAMAYVSIQSVGKVLNLSDELAQTTARLDQMNDGAQSTEKLFDMVYAAAQDSRGSVTEMAGVVARFGNNAKDAFGSSAEVVEFATLVQKQMSIAGASGTEASNAMLQLSQALGSGVLRGDELNSIFEQAPNLIQSIADYLDVPIGKIREMASEGEISADIVKAAVFASADEINTKFDAMPMTWEQVWQSMKNQALVAFQPILQRLNELANSESFQAFVNGVMNAMSMLATIILDIFDLIGTVGEFMADNWSMIGPVIYGVIAALGIYVGYLAGMKAAELIAKAGKIAMCFASYAHAAATKSEATATAVATAKQRGFNTALLSSPIFWIVIAVIALVAAVIALCNWIAEVTGVAETGFGVIAGSVNVVIQFFKNLGLTVANIALGIGSAIGALGENIMTAFRNAICSVQSWWYDLLSTCLTVIEKICAALNKLPFVEFDYSGISDAADDYAAKAGEAAGKKEDYTSVLDAFDEGMSTFDTFQDGWIEDAFRAGADWGDGLFSSGGDEVYGAGIAPVGNLLGNNLPPNDYGAGFGEAIESSGMGDNLGSIAEDTGNISDSMDITQEDLKYLRDIAEQETVNRYTVAEINIDQSGMQNTVNSGSDIDGFMLMLTDSVNEAVDTMTEGVHK